MEPRLRYAIVDPAARDALLGLESYVVNCGVEESLLDLVRIRASQINRCAFCLDMHWKDARASGETEQRLYALSAWRESPFYTERERAALAWTEAVTVLTDGFVPDALYDEVRPHFTDAELVAVTMAVVAINSWNRVNVAFRTAAGNYHSARKPHQPETAPAGTGSNH